RPRAPLVLAAAPSGGPLDARARAGEVPPLPAALPRAPLPPALLVAARAPADAVGGPTHDELVRALPAHPHAHGDAAAQASRPLLRGRLPERGRHPGGVGRAPVHLLERRRVRAVPRRGAGGAGRRRARPSHARDPAPRDVREVRARRAHPAAAALSGAERRT